MRFDRSDFVPGHWWRVIDVNGKVKCESSNEKEARGTMVRGDHIQRLWVLEVSEWRDE